MKSCKSGSIVTWLSLLGVCLLPTTHAASSPSLLPQPVSVRWTEGTFELSPSTLLVVSETAQAEGDTLIDMLKPFLAYERAKDSVQQNDIMVELDTSLQKGLGTEGYKLKVSPERIRIRAAGRPGLFYAIQTLRQLLPAEVYSPKKVEAGPWSVPCVTITDYPRFKWRGLLVDPARHFIPKADMLRFIDLMAAHKFNRLQVHFTDNEGWRLAIRKYPKLAEIGSRMNHSRRRDDAGRLVGGFYSEEDIKEIVRYAADRHITIIPEIEMPFHTGAAIVAHPGLGINMGHLSTLAPEQRWGKTKGLIAPRPKTVAFLQDVLREVMELFPSQYIHIGGDEANTGHWAADPEMQTQMRRLKLADAHALHSWFIKQMDSFLTENGRRLVGWDEILQGGLAPGATVMSWRGTAGGITAARAGHDVVMAPTSHTYFDYRQAPDETGLGRNVIDLQKVYSFEPIPPELNAAQAKRILGGQGQLWGELIPDAKRREFMAFPRACALSEVLWTPTKKRSFPLFLRRLLEHRKRLNAAGVNYRPLDQSLIETVTVSAAHVD